MERSVQKRHSVRQHCNLQSFLLFEMLEQLFQSDISIDIKSIPNSIKLFVVVLVRKEAASFSIAPWSKTAPAFGSGSLSLAWIFTSDSGLNGSKEILDSTASLGQVWNHNLSVTLGSQSTRFKQRLLEEHTSSVNVASGLDIIQGVGNKVEVFPEFVVEDVLRVRTNFVNFRLDFALQVWVHNSDSLRRDLRLVLSDIFWSEQELSV
ncbi:hypothetical protein OGAPHI_004498 [Ogataea philodendri]|uniref:Uncharacterized protein n=1 Tax=Ogataea philodendri TaxID=1378263 RepID=A0A9P8P7C0_9ASCO|nr:uncharacterized protein OGAPHI_004498 [Ogataea philodendri]KAH3666309.1 hypothetical protein OGAPHI_004498 [Ogataea philodendri]